jgi:hypothetical protein
MEFDLNTTFDAVGEGVRNVGDAAHEATASFHENYVSKIVPIDGMFGDVITFAAEMVPGVAEYNAVREGDWTGLAVAIGIDAAMIGATVFTTGVGTGAAIGARAGIRVAAREMAQVGETAAKKAIIEGSAEAVAQQVVREGVETGAKTVVRESTEEVVESGARRITIEGTEEAAEKVARETGGSYKDVKAAVETGQNKEVHHMPPDSVSHIDRNDGPAIAMETADHRLTASWGSSREAQEYRNEQEKLVKDGKFKEAMQMDIDDIHAKFGDKYDDAISEMKKYVDILESEGKI